MTANDSRFARSSVAHGAALYALASALACSGSADADTDSSSSGVSSTGATASGDDTAGTEPVDTEPVDTEATSETDPDASSSTDAADDTTGPPPTLCGDGIAEGEEACDDGNAVDGDGCNEGCIASGSPVWTWSAGGQKIADMAVADNGSIFVAVQDTDGSGGNIVELSADGEVLRTLALPIPAGPAGTTLDFRASTIDTIGSEPVYTSEARYLNVDGIVETIHQTIQLFGAQGWMLEQEGPLRQGVSADATDRLVGFRGDDVVEFDGMGNIVWTTPVPGTDGVRARSAGGVFGFDRLGVWALDDIGDPLWAVDTSDKKLVNTVLAIAEAPGGTLLVMQDVPEGERSSGVLWSIDASGEVLSAEALESSAAAIAIDGDGTLFLPVESETALAKRTADDEILWTYAYGGPPIIDVELHPEGVAVVALRDDTVSKLAF